MCDPQLHPVHGNEHDPSILHDRLPELPRVLPPERQSMRDGTLSAAVAIAFVRALPHLLLFRSIENEGRVRIARPSLAPAEQGELLPRAHPEIQAEVDPIRTAAKPLQVQEGHDGDRVQASHHVLVLEEKTYP